MRILLTGAGGPASVSVWKSLHQEHELHMADIDASAAGLYLVPAAQRVLLPRGEAADFVEKVLSICKQRKIELVIATVDSELAPLAKALNLFQEIGIKVPLSPYQALLTCRDKYALLTKAQTIVPIPRSILLNQDNLAQVQDFPCFAKPRFGAGSNGIMVIKDAQGLKQLPLNDSYLIQELLPDDEYSVDTYIDSRGLAIAAVPRLRMKVDSGVAVTARTEHLPLLSELALKIAQAIGIRYVANIQFKKSMQGEFKLLEINSRFSGALPLTTAAGVDIPKLLIKDIQGQALPMGLMPFKDLMVTRYWTETFFPCQEWEDLVNQNKLGL